MIICYYQVPGAAGVEVFYPAEMVEKVEQEVRRSATHHNRQKQHHSRTRKI